MSPVQSQRLRVVEHRPGRRFATLFGIAVTIVIAFIAGRYWGQAQTEQRLAEAAAISRAHDAARERIAELEGALADVDLANAVQPVADEELRTTIKELRDQLADRQEELRFYRQLMAPSRTQRGLRIERLDLVGSGVDRPIQYRLMLSQVVDRHDWVQGKVRLELHGTADGAAAAAREAETAAEAANATVPEPEAGSEKAERVLSLTDLGVNGEYPLDFRFRYFQDFSGTFTVPEGFEPARVVVTAVTSGRDAKEIQRSFGWQLKEG